jgi:hypothetical protein
LSSIFLTDDREYVSLLSVVEYLSHR